MNTSTKPTARQIRNARSAHATAVAYSTMIDTLSELLVAGGGEVDSIQYEVVSQEIDRLSRIEQEMMDTVIFELGECDNWDEYL